MDQRISLPTTLALGAALLCTLPALAEPAAPQAVVEQAVVDLGRVTQAEKATHRFTISNQGDAALVIHEVRPACGCTVAHFDERIGPGKSGTVTAEVDTTSFRGPIAKSVTVLTNDPQNPRIRLTLKATVEPYVTVRPGWIRYMTVSGSPPPPAPQLVWATDGSRLTVEKATSTVSHLEVRVHRASEQERSSEGPAVQWVVEATLDRDAPVGPLAGKIVVTTDDAHQPRVEIPVAGFVQPQVEVAPRQLDLGTFATGQRRRGSLQVTNRGTAPVHVTGVESSVPGLTAEVVEQKEGRSYQIALVVDRSEAGSLAGTLRVLTDSPAVPEVEVQVRGQVE